MRLIYESFRARSTVSICLLIASVCHLAPNLSSAAADALVSNFENPPRSAKPTVWWHWMDGNISKEGVRLDLEWMKRVGIGGIQLFEAGMGTPTVTDRRFSFMSPDWRDAFRFSAETAQSLDLDLTIAASPGWSATGGPWVKPQDAMKKLVWSQTRVRGGQRYRGVLPKPPSVTGPFQDVPLNAVSTGPPSTDAFYADVAFVAFRYPAEAFLAKKNTPRTTSSSGPLEVKSLTDGKFGPSISIPLRPDGTAWVQYEYPTLRTVRAVRIGLPGLRGFGAPPPPDARLEVSRDGHRYTTVVEMAPTSSPVRSASFAPVSARFFRVMIFPYKAPGPDDRLDIAPGAAMPTFGSPDTSYQVSEFDLFTEGRVNAVEEKAGFATASDYYPLATPKEAVMNPVATADVIDLSGRMRGDGSLDWAVPPGNWTIVRFGYSLTGRRNGPAPPEATGLEVDKLDPARVAAYLNHYLGMFDETLGGDKLAQGSIKGLLSDSIEAGPQNWTDDILLRFRELRGYDPTPWLPALTGVVVGSGEASDRFLWDFRRTIAQLLGANHYGALAAGAHSRGLKYYAEALEDHRPQLGDDMEMRRYADFPMGAMWTIPRNGQPKPTYIADLQGAASVGHVYGKPIIAAESLTAFGRPWGFAPRDLKATVDLEMSLGVNQFAIHESAHQPLIGPVPGLALATILGQYFNRNDTWAEAAGAWVSYLARSSLMLQQGHYTADVAYFYGEEAPLTSLYGNVPLADIPTGFAFDFVGADALLHQLSVDNGTLRAADMRYQVLYLGGTSREMTLPVINKIAELLRAGAVVIGMRPQSSPSLADRDADFRKAVDDIWGMEPSLPGMRRIGPGRLVVSNDLASALTSLGCEPDWTVTGTKAPTDLAVLHRRLDDGDVYFVSNRRSDAAAAELSVRVAGKQAELWHADTGAIEPAAYRIAGHRTTIPLSLDAGEAVFVVLRQHAEAPYRAFSRPKETIVATLPENWSLSFQDGRGTPAEESVVGLQSWSESLDARIRYFSGTGTYKQGFTVTASTLSSGNQILLDLGSVDDLAVVTVNGREAGTLWKAPYRIDISTLVKSGENTLSIAVTNLWTNRLIGDAQSGAKPITFTTGPTYTADAPLRPSGLLGPVRLISRQNPATQEK